jgi:hypothetical protein
MWSWPDRSARCLRLNHPRALIIFIGALDEPDAGRARTQLLKLVGAAVAAADCRVAARGRHCGRMSCLSPLKLTSSDEQQQQDVRFFIQSQIGASNSVAQLPATVEKTVVKDFVAA